MPGNPAEVPLSERESCPMPAAGKPVRCIRDDCPQHSRCVVATRPDDGRREVTPELPEGRDRCARYSNPKDQWGK